MTNERYAFGLTPLPTAARVARKRSALRMRVISAVISLALLVGVLQAGTVVHQRADGTTVTDSIPGVHAAFVTATVIAAIVLVLTCFMRRSTPTEVARVGDDAAR